MRQAQGAVKHAGTKRTQRIRSGDRQAAKHGGNAPDRALDDHRDIGRCIQPQEGGRQSPIRVAEEYIRKNILMKAQAARQYSEWLEKFVIEQQRGLTEAASALATLQEQPARSVQARGTAKCGGCPPHALRKYLDSAYGGQAAHHPIPVSDATIVSRATLPLSKARPRSALIVAFATAVGAGARLDAGDDTARR